MATNTSTEEAATFRPPRDDLFRVMSGGVEVREAGADGSPVLHGHFAVFNEWAEINSAYEGNFMERFSPGAFSKTLDETTPKVLFQHGFDPVLGDQVLGTPRSISEDETGAAYEVELFDGIPELVMRGLRANAYGASFRFKAFRENIVDNPDPSETNPEGLPERTVVEARVPEFGPVTFPAYESASAGIRSMTDYFRSKESLRGLDIAELEELLEDARELRQAGEQPAEDDGAEEAPHPVPGRHPRRFTLDRGVTRWTLR